MDRKALIERFLDAYNHFDVDGMVELVDSEIQFSNVSDGEVNAVTNGLDEFRSLAEQSATLFSSRKQTPVRFQMDNDTVNVDIDFVGILAADMPNAKAGDTLRVSGRSEYVFRGGSIYRLTDYS